MIFQFIQIFITSRLWVEVHKQCEPQRRKIIKADAAKCRAFAVGVCGVLFFLPFLLDGQKKWEKIMND